MEIKQEVLSDEEQGDAYIASGTEHSYVEAELSNLDIKIEPEEMVEQPPMNITINGKNFILNLFFLNCDRTCISFKFLDI